MNILYYCRILHRHEREKKSQFEHGHVNSIQEAARESSAKVAGCEAVLKHFHII